MNTKQAAIGRWAEIYKHYGLPELPGKTTLKGNVLCVVVRANSGVTIKTVPGHTSACVVQVMAGRC